MREDTVKYEITMEIEKADIGFIKNSRSNEVDVEEVGRTSWEWTMGVEIAHIILRCEAVLTHNGLMDIFGAINAVGEDFEESYKKMVS